MTNCPRVSVFAFFGPIDTVAAEMLERYLLAALLVTTVTAQLAVVKAPSIVEGGSCVDWPTRLKMKPMIIQLVVHTNAHCSVSRARCGSQMALSINQNGNAYLFVG